MELPPIYKENNYEKLARENQEIVRKVGYPYDLNDNDPLLLKFINNERILGMYLYNNYKDKFERFGFSFPDGWQKANHGQYSIIMVDKLLARYRTTI